ncbi:MAG: hypothetical protein WCT14_01830 [Treponemataceae bacterium]
MRLTLEKSGPKKKRLVSGWVSGSNVFETTPYKTNKKAKATIKARLVVSRSSPEDGGDPNIAVKVSADESWKDIKTGIENIWSSFKDSVFHFKSRTK